MIGIKQTQRIDWVDLAKGFAILLVVVGHVVLEGETFPFHLIHGIIYSFHMPLFFILSMRTSKLSENRDRLKQRAKKSFRHLILPALVFFGIKTVMDLLKNGMTEANWFVFVQNKITTLVYASGSPFSVNDTYVKSIELLWFLFALFLGKVLYDYLHLTLTRKTFVVTLAVCSVLGICNFLYLPFSLDIVLVILPLLAFGDYLKRIDLTKKWFLYGFIALGVWLTSFAYVFWVTDNFLDFANRQYPLFHLCFLPAVAGVVFVCCLCIALTKLGVVMKPLIYLGRYSLYFFCVHAVDDLFSFFWASPDDLWLRVLFRLLTDIVLFILVRLLIWLWKILSEKSTFRNLLKKHQETVPEE